MNLWVYRRSFVRAENRFNGLARQEDVNSRTKCREGDSDIRTGILFLSVDSLIANIQKRSERR